MWHSSGTGRTLGLKLQSPGPVIPSQSARSWALASAVDRPTNRMLRSVCGTGSQALAAMHRLHSIPLDSQPSLWTPHPPRHRTVTHLGSDVAHARDDDLQDGPAVGAQQVDLVDDQQAHLRQGAQGAGWQRVSSGRHRQVDELRGGAAFPQTAEGATKHTLPSSTHLHPPPSRTLRTYDRLCQLREMPSHFSGVHTMTSAASRDCCTQPGPEGNGQISSWGTRRPPPGLPQTPALSLSSPPPRNQRHTMSGV